MMDGRLSSGLLVWFAAQSAWNGDSVVGLVVMTTFGLVEEEQRISYGQVVAGYVLGRG